MQHAHLVGGDHGIDGGVRRDSRRLGRFIASGRGPGQVFVGMGVDVANAQHEVALAGILDRVVPGGDDGEAVHPGCFGRRAGAAHVRPFGHVPKVLEVADGGVVQLAHRVVGFVRTAAGRDLAELVQVVDDAAVDDGHAEKRGGVVGVGQIRVDRQHTGVAVPFRCGVGDRGRVGHRLRRADELLTRPQHTTVAQDAVVVEVAKGAVAQVVGVLLQQARGLVVASREGRAIGFNTTGAGTGVANLHAHADFIHRRADHSHRRVIGCGRVVDVAGLRKAQLVAQALHAHLEGAPCKRRRVSNSAAAGGGAVGEVASPALA